MLFFKLVRAPGNDSIDDTGRSNRVRSPAGGVSAVAAAVVAVVACELKFPVLAWWCPEACFHHRTSSVPPTLSAAQFRNPLVGEGAEVGDASLRGRKK